MLRRGSGWSLPFLLCPSTEPLKGQAAQRRVYPEEPQAHTHTPSAINCNLIQQALPIICTRPGLHQKGKEKGERRERVSGEKEGEEGCERVKRGVSYGEMEKGAAEGKEEGRGQALSQWSRSGFRAGRKCQLCPRQGSPAMLADAQTSHLQRGSPTYMVASSQTQSWSPPPPGRHGPHTSSSQCCCGTGWARSVPAHHIRGRTAQGAGAAGSPPSRRHAPAPAGIGFSPLLLRERGKKSVISSSPHTQLGTWGAAWSLPCFVLLIKKIFLFTFIEGC